MGNECTVIRTKTAKQKPQAGEPFGFGRIFTDHMFVMEYFAGQGWVDPRIIPYAPLEMDPSAMVLHYSQTIFEGMKAYRRPDGGVNLFRPQLNFERFNKSADRMAMPQVDEELVLGYLKQLLALDAEWVPGEPGTSLYIRPFMFATDEFLGVRASNSYKFLIIMSPSGSYYGNSLQAIPIYIEDRYVRAVRGGVGFAKTGGNYAASVKSQQLANEAACDQVLWLDGVERRYVEEVGSMNVFFVERGALVTPKLNGSILPGITRRSVMQLAESIGIEVSEQSIAVDELVSKIKSGDISEAFGSGTAAVISPIGSLMYEGQTISLGDGNTGEIAQRVFDQLTGIQYGKIDDLFGWAFPIEE